MSVDISFLLIYGVIWFTDDACVLVFGTTPRPETFICIIDARPQERKASG